MAEQSGIKMVVVSKATTEQYSNIKKCMPTTFSLTIPIVDLSKPDAKTLIVKACEDFGFFKVINHSVPMEAISDLESEAFKFFSMPLNEKEKVGPPNPFGYGSKKIGSNGDVGCVEYLLLNTNQEHNLSVYGKYPEKFRCLLNSYMSSIRKMACEILELMAEGLKIQQKDVFSRLLMDKQSDSIFRVNHYPASSKVPVNDQSLIGFGEHTDPQIISLLRSNNTSGLQIYLKDGDWISVPPDHKSFFINVGDSLQSVIQLPPLYHEKFKKEVEKEDPKVLLSRHVMTNGRFHSVKHRVLTNEFKSRLSMIYFGGPPLSEKITPLPSIMKGKESLYKEFTWSEYKNFTYGTKLADNRLGHFERN